MNKQMRQIVKVNSRSRDDSYKFYKNSLLEMNLKLILIVMGKNVFAPCDGIIVQREGAYKERARTKFLSDMSNAYKNAQSFDPKRDDIQLVGHSGSSSKYLKVVPSGKWG